MKTHTIAILEGDGIGPEIMREALKVLDVIEARSGVRFERRVAPFGGRAYFETGAAFPEETKAVCDAADAILKGPIGLSLEESRKIPVEEQPERGALLPLRQRYHTFANFRPVYLPPELVRFSPLRPERIEGGIDIVMIRELVGGLYFGEKTTGTTATGERFVKETLEYEESEIRNILVVAFEEARKRKRLLHSVHKSNVLLSSVLWNDILDEVAVDYPDVEHRHVIVDAAATALVLNPRQFDVMVMENMFGDILSDLGGGLVGSLGLMPSACIGAKKAYYEPSHGSAPDIAGKGIANPYSMIGSLALMLEKSFGMNAEADRIRAAMCAVFARGYTTADLRDPAGKLEPVSTAVFGDKVVEALRA
ncbi:MAG TPA: 3-isopropylmalate dehydrogenase [Candidatus Hydrogenedentes bacterium]|nr:3-isopropylmalate dehydrogenase [Candidatus Hydrogenedentota bacterium]HNT87637.1 3-isopropylmalate dehydrogenase [Candidatus Hydrogenedentota bacterium]